MKPSTSIQIKSFWLGFILIMTSSLTAANTKPQPWWKIFKGVNSKASESQPDEAQQPSVITLNPPQTNDDYKKWSVGFNLSSLDPALSEWNSYYNHSHVTNYGLDLHYYLEPNWSLTFGFDYINAKGRGFLSQTNALGAEVEYTLIPYQLGLQYEVELESTKVVRPMMSLGYAYAQYTQDSSSGADVKGHEDGYFLNGGFMFNFYHLKALPSNGNSTYQNIYWLLQAKKLWLKSGSGQDIGGLNYSFGLQIRF